jgi:hypothetical protein
MYGEVQVQASVLVLGLHATFYLVRWDTWSCISCVDESIDSLIDSLAGSGWAKH